jgi:hypothetical protein
VREAMQRSRTGRSGGGGSFCGGGAGLWDRSARVRLGALGLISIFLFFFFVESSSKGCTITVLELMILRSELLSLHGWELSWSDITAHRSSY